MLIIMLQSTLQDRVKNGTVLKKISKTYQKELCLGGVLGRAMWQVKKETLRDTHR